MNTMIKALITKEWIKIRRLGWLPIILIIAFLVDYYSTLSGAIKVQGAVVTWLAIAEKQAILFPNIFWVFILSGIFWGFLQSLPETNQGRSRLSLHLPCSPILALSMPTAIGLVLIGMLYIVALCGLILVHKTIGFPDELASQIQGVLFPWMLAGVVSWCAAYSLVAETSRFRAVLQTGFAICYLAMLSANSGFNGYTDSKWLYALATLPWIFVPFVSAYRIHATSRTLEFSRLANIVVGVIALSWFIPGVYTQMTKSDYFSMSGLWSPVKEDFIIRHYRATGTNSITSSGDPLSFRETRQALPFFYRHDLNKWKAFPIVINGKTINYNDTEKSEFTRIRPIQFNPRIPVMTALMESRPEGSSFELPDDLMVFSDTEIRFVNPLSGAINLEKTQKFNLVLSNAKVQFPIQKVAINTSIMKPFDEGIFMIDNAQQLVQLRMVHGKPHVRIHSRKLPDNVRLLGVDEDPAHLYSSVVATDDSVYLNLYDGGLTKLPIENLNIREDTVGIWATPLSYTVVVTKDSGDGEIPDMRLIALTPEMELIKEISVPYPEEIQKTKILRDNILSFISPFTIRQYDPLIRGVFLSIKGPTNYFSSIAGGIFALLLFSLIHRMLIKRTTNSLVKRRFPTPTYIIGLLVSSIFGLPGLVAILATWPVGSLVVNSPKKN